MAVPFHRRITFSGIFGTVTTPVENWSFNLSMTGNPQKTLAPLQTLADAAGAAWTSHLAPLYWPSTRLARVRAAEVESDGLVSRQASGAYLQADHVQDRPGLASTGTENRMPLSAALVVSLQTARPGQAGKGRFFLPWPSFTGIATDYRLPTATAESIADAAKAFLAALNTAAGSPVIVVGASSSITGKEPTSSVVTAVRVGRVPDTMRSRRSSMLEGYVTRSL